MKSRYEQSPRFNAVGLATGSILALMAALGISLVFDVQPADAKTSTQVAHTAIAARA